MVNFKLCCVILLIGFLQAYGIEINSCVPEKQNASECTTTVNIPRGGVKGLRVGPDFVVRGKLVYFKNCKIGKLVIFKLQVPTNNF